MRVGLWDGAATESAYASASASARVARTHDEGWQAELALQLELRHGRTSLWRAEHRGPLRVQRAFHPEANGTCHVYVLHPPGGVANGDELHVNVEVGSAARALLTTPGAGKLYRSRGATAHVTQRLKVASGAWLEWFPQETIVFSGAEARLSTHVQIAAAGTYAGWEIVCLGRPSCGERFARGSLRTELRIELGGRLRFMERGDFRADDAVLDAAWGLHGQPVFGLFVVAHERASEEWVERVRAEVEASQGLFSVTLVSGILLARYLGSSTLDARRSFERMFALLRPLYAGSAAVPPRIWRT